MSPVDTTAAESPHAPTLHHLATREPMSFHQSTIYYGLVRQNTPAWRKKGLMAASIGIVFLQCLVATGLSQGVSLSTCRDNQDCNEGTYCDKGVCEWCESEWQHCCTNSTEACYSGWDDKEVEDMCAACVTDRGFETHAEVVRERVDSMMLQDWLALALASMVVAFAVFAEMRDALLCTNSLRDISKRRKVPRIWRYAIRGLTFARYYIMLPNVILSVVTLVLNDGGRVKDVCLNTVAVLFLLEIDNLAFLHGLGERTRMEAEEHAGMCVTDDDVRTINKVKIVCVFTIPCVVLAGACGGYVIRDYPETLSILIAPVPSMVVVFLQHVKNCRGVCGGLSWGMASFLVYLTWYWGMMELAYLSGYDVG